jgi:hypothetical protein
MDHFDGRDGATGATGANGSDGKDGAVIEVPAPSQELTAVEELIVIENEYRSLLGQSMLSRGLVCSLYTVPNGSGGIVGTTLTGVTSYTYTGSINQPESPAADGLNILPPAFRATYLSWFVVRCTGKIVIEKSVYVKFDLNSDDGSLLYVGGSLLINNDGNHAPLLKSGTKLLKQGVHDIRLDYMQGPAGSQALQLNVDALTLYH